MTSWNDWGNTVREPVPAGRYVAKISNASMTFDQNGVARTEVTFEIVEGECAARLIWFDYPHKVEEDGRAPFGWACRMMWEALGFEGQPNGQGPIEWFQNVARAITERVGAVVNIETMIRTYQNKQGETVAKAKIKRVSKIANVQTNQPTGEAPQW